MRDLIVRFNLPLIYRLNFNCIGDNLYRIVVILFGDKVRSIGV